jgi:hypothetical protein
VQAFSASPRERICSEAGSAEALSREHPKSRAAPQRRCTAGTPRRDFKGGQRRCTGTASIPSSDADCSGNASSLLDRGKPLGTLASRAPRRSLGTRIISYANSYSQGIGDSLGTAGISEASNAHRLCLGLRDDNSRVGSSEAQHCGCTKSRDGLRRGADPAGTESRAAPREERARRPKPRTYPHRPPSLLALYIRSRTAAQRRCTAGTLRQDSTLLLSLRCHCMWVRRERRLAWRCTHLTRRYANQ